MKSPLRGARQKVTPECDSRHGTTLNTFGNFRPFLENLKSPCAAMPLTHTHGVALGQGRDRLAADGVELKGTHPININSIDPIIMACLLSM